MRVSTIAASQDRAKVLLPWLLRLPIPIHIITGTTTIANTITLLIMFMRVSTIATSPGRAKVRVLLIQLIILMLLILLILLRRILLRLPSHYQLLTCVCRRSQQRHQVERRFKFWGAAWDLEPSPVPAAALGHSWGNTAGESGGRASEGGGDKSSYNY